MVKSNGSSKSADQKPLNFWQVLTSSLMAGLGVQSNHIRERDFTKGNVIHFVAAGLVLTAGFLFGLIAVVNLIV